MLHTCPICRKFVIHRKEVKTCGAPECLQSWRQSTLQQRSFAIESASMADDDFLQALRALAKPTDVTTPTDEDAETSASDFTKRILGE